MKDLDSSHIGRNNTTWYYICMPSPRIVKEYEKDSFYHIYNRGINRMNIFKDVEDYQVFINYLRLNLTPTKYLVKELEQFLKIDGSNFQTKQLNNAILKGLKYQIYRNIDLLAYCLMPNHFHLVIYQKVKSGIEILMRRVATGYSQYFNKRYHRQGTLFENRYKANHLQYDPELQALFTARYVERNPLKLSNKPLAEYPYLSLGYYKEKIQNTAKTPIWFNTRRLTNIFHKIKSKPNSIIEEEVAKIQNYYQFVTGDINISLEDVRLSNIW